MVNFRPKAERDLPNHAGPVPVIFQISYNQLLKRWQQVGLPVAVETSEIVLNWMLKIGKLYSLLKNTY